MFKVLTVILSTSACAISIWAPRAAWIVIGFVDAFFIGQLAIVRKHYRLERIDARFSPETSALAFSPEVTALADKYGHYFLVPFASRDYSASSATLQVFGIALAVITWFTGFRSGVLCASVNWVLMGYAAHSFSPAAVLAKHPDMRFAHDEIFQILEVRRSGGG